MSHSSGQVDSEMSLVGAEQFTEDALLDALRGATLGRFDIYAELGRGGMAAVFLALDIALDRKVAIKAMLPEISADLGAVERFRREARLAASLSHPHIIPIFAVGESVRPAYFVMKYVDGRSLDSVLLNEGAQSPAFVQTVLQQVGAALEYAHRRGITHRDIKPANIMLDEGGWAMLTDFGIAKASDSMGLTSSGMIVGTPTYMSPEHFSGDAVGPAADQYALGCVAYELLTGRRAFERNTIAEVMKAHLLDDPTPLRELVPSCPPRLAECIHRMIAKNANDRFASLAELTQTLGVAEPDLLHQVTTHIINLAKSGAASRPKISQPISPSPLRSSNYPTPPVIASQRATETTGVPATPANSRAGVLWSLGAAALGVVGTALWFISREPNPARADSAAARSDSAAASTASTPTAANTRPSEPPTQASPPSPTTRVVDGARTASGTSRPASKPTGLAEKRTAADSNASAVAPSAAPPTDTVAVPPPAVVVPPPTPAVTYAIVVIGSKSSDAALYIDGVLQRMAPRRLQSYRLTPGKHTVMITAEGCTQPWDTTLTVAAGDSVPLNYRTHKCTPN